MIAYVKMGASKAKLGSSLPANVSVGADWGGPEAIAHELTEVQLQLSHLNNPTSASEVELLCGVVENSPSTLQSTCWISSIVLCLNTNTLSRC